MNHTENSTSRLACAAERLRLRGLEAEEHGHTSLANLCWRKYTEALNRLATIVVEDALIQHRERHMERIIR